MRDPFDVQYVNAQTDTLVHKHLHLHTYMVWRTRVLADPNNKHLTEKCDFRKL